MRLFIYSIIGCVCLSAAQAAEIAAWKFRLAKLLDYQLELQDLTPLKAPPEKSVFFNENDKFHAFSKEQIQEFLPTEPALEWAVWNETTGTLVTKSDWNGFLQLQMRMPQPGPLQIRTTLSCHEVIDINQAPDMKSKPVMQASTLCRSGEKAEIGWKQGPAALSFQTETTIDVTDELVHVRLDGSVQQSDEKRIHLNTAATLGSGKSQWIARDHDGKSGMDFILSSRIEFLDGTPIHEAIQLQRDGKKHSIDMRRSYRMATEKISETHLLMTMRMPFYLIHDLVDTGADSGGEIDPFAPTTPEPLHKPDRIEEVKAPEKLKGWFPNLIWDMRTPFRDCGITIQGEDYIGYDPITQTLFFYTDKPLEIDKIDQLLSFGCCGNPSMTFVTWDQMGQSAIIGRSGEMARISRMSKDGPSLRTFEIEPTIGENNDMASLRLRAEDNSRPDQAILLNGAYTLHFGGWNTVAEVMEAGERQTSRVKLEFIDIHAH